MAETEEWSREHEQDLKMGKGPLSTGDGEDRQAVPKTTGLCL